jgi:uncharacterized membrane protein (GlpM family)
VIATISPPLTILLRGLAGGALVLAFALLAETLQPKRFAGLFSAAPAVAVASLAIGLATKPASQSHESAIGMVAGAVAMVAYVLAVVPALRRTSAVGASAGAVLVWLAVAALGLVVVGA